jgi:hypothetical protein
MRNRLSLILVVFPSEPRRGAAGNPTGKDVQMGEFDKNEQGNGEFGSKSAFGQFDNDQNQQDRVNRTEQGSDDKADADAGQDLSSAREQEIGQQGDFIGKGGEQQGQEEAQQGDNQYMKEKGQGDDQNR